MVQSGQDATEKVSSDQTRIHAMPLMRAIRRYVWEIVLGAHEYFVKEESLVNVDIEEGMTIDVIGDVHGEQSFIQRPVLSLTSACRPILRHASSLLAYWRAERESLSTHER